MRDSFPLKGQTLRCSSRLVCIVNDALGQTNFCKWKLIWLALYSPRTALFTLKSSKRQVTENQHKFRWVPLSEGKLLLSPAPKAALLFPKWRCWIQVTIFPNIVNYFFPDSRMLVTVPWGDAQEEWKTKKKKKNCTKSWSSLPRILCPLNRWIKGLEEFI